MGKIGTKLGALLVKHGVPTDSASACYSQVGDGWLPLIEDLIIELKKLDWNLDVHQIKEKFGGLRFYTGDTTSEMDDLIRKAEAASFKICEDCSKPGKATTPRGWIRTLCVACDEKRNATPN